MATPYGEILKYYFNAENGKNAQSSFIQSFVNDVMDTNRAYYHFEPIEKIRESLVKSREEIEFVDFGAGGVGNSTYKTKVSRVAKRSLSNTWQCRILFSLINKYQCLHNLEMGTSLGISAMYLASANRKSRLITLEGNPSSAKIARDGFTQLGLNNIEVKVGSFDKTFDAALNDLCTIDFAFIDGNHRYEPTIEYFNKILDYSHKDTILVFDDIYWSGGMLKAWNEVRNHPEVTLSIDLFRMGILFFRKTDAARKHYQLINKKYKPF